MRKYSYRRDIVNSHIESTYIKYGDAMAEIAELKERHEGRKQVCFTQVHEIAELKAFAKYLHENAQTVWDEGLTLEKEFSLFKHITLEKSGG